MANGKRSYRSSEKTIMKNIKNEREHICYYCNKQIVEQSDLTIDHKEHYNGYNTTYENCVISCLNCNGEKKSMNEEQFYKYLSYKLEMSKHTREVLEVSLDKIITLLRSVAKQEDVLGFEIYLGHKAQALRRLIKEVSD